MARIRTIKPDFWSDGKNVNLSPLARLLFIGSWNFAMCDDGHLPDDPFGLKLKVLPADDVDAIELLDELLFSGQVVRGSTADGRSYLHIPRLRDHQKVDGRWTPRCFVCSQEPAQTRPASPKLPETRASLDESRGDSPQEGKGKEGKGKTTPNGVAPRKRGHRIPDDFSVTSNMREWAHGRGFNDAQITEITETFIRHWQASSGATASKLDWPKAWQNWVAKEDPSRVRGVASLAAVPDRRLTNSELENLLGPDVWSPPDAPAGMTPDEAWEWQRERRLEHIAERQAIARTRLGRTA